MKGIRSRNTGKLDEIRSRLKGIDAELPKDDISRRIQKNNPEPKTENEANDASKKSSSEGSPKSEEKQIKTTENEGFLKGLQTATREGEKTSNEKAEPTNEETIKSLMDRALKAEKQAQAYKDRIAELEKNAKNTSESKADNSAKTEEPKATNSGTEETVTPEGETKVDSGSETNTEQPQATQMPKKETKKTSKSSKMTPEEVYKYLSDKKNFNDAEQYFASGKDAYIGTNNKHIPKSWFDAFKENKDKDHSVFFSKNNKDVFAASLRDKGLLKDSNKKPDRAETERVKAETEAKRKFDEEINSRGNKLKGIIGRHPWLTGGLALSVGAPAILKLIDELGDWGAQKAIDDDQVSDSEFFGGNQDDSNGPGSDEVTEDLSNAAQETGQGNNSIEEQAAQALQANLPQGVAGLINQNEAESRVADNTAIPVNNAASGTSPNAKQAFKQSNTAVANNAPVTNSDSSGMTYNANNPDIVTADLVNAMNQAPQAGSDAIGYDDLYDQNFIDFWAKRNPNLAFGVSQGRKA